MREKPKSKSAQKREKFKRKNRQKDSHVLEGHGVRGNEEPISGENLDNLDHETTEEVIHPGHDSGPTDQCDYEYSDIENQIVPGNQMFSEVVGKEILLIMKADQLNLFGQTFRPIFCGLVREVTNGFITLDPVIIKMTNAPYHCFPTPLSFPIEQISTFTPFDCDRKIPLT